MSIASYIKRLRTSEFGGFENVLRDAGIPIIVASTDAMIREIPVSTMDALTSTTT